jgi:hypothetical protein
VGLLEDDLMARNNIGDVAYCGKSLQTLNEDSGDQLYRYFLHASIMVTYQKSCNPKTPPPSRHISIKYV